MPTSIRKTAPPITERATPGCENEIWRMWWRERIAWLEKKAIRTAGSVSANATAAKTAVFAQSTGRRFGTAVKLARIIPVEYSPVITNTPNTATASCDTLTPASAMSSGWRSARSCALMEPQCDDVSAAKRTGNRIVSRTAASSDQRVERSERSFVHSETTTLGPVTRPVCSSVGSCWTCETALRGPPPPSRARLP